MKKLNLLLIIAITLSLIGATIGCSKSAQTTKTTTATTAAATSTTAKPTVATTAVATTTATTTTAAKPVDPIKIGILDDMTGAIAAYGTAYNAGVKLAIQIVNDAGGIKSLGGAKIVYAQGSGDSTVPTATSEVERLISSEKISALIGPTATAEVLASIPTLERYKIPAVTILGDTTQFQKGYRYIFSTYVSMQSLGIQQAEFINWLAKNYGAATDKMGYATIAPSLTTQTEAAIARLAELGYKNVVLNETFPATTTDQGPLVLKLKAANATMVLYNGIGQDGIAFHKACDTYDYHPWLIVNSVAINGSVKDAIGATAAKNIFARPNVFSAGSGAPLDAYSKIPSLSAFQVALKKAYPDAKFEFNVAATGAQRAFVLLRAIENAASRDPEAIANALRKVDIKSPDAYLVGFEQYPELKMTDSGQASTGYISASQWTDDLSSQQIVWPEAISTAKPKATK